ncbi:AMP-dependent synthetase/ligase [Penicillium concentricum]|uniref:AMP-dependent synthetase/ligase n=1 Tax=Penicillium concentricum TaxID=293559 RepID=A0A9W9SD58_9EURO|nr:AMP-dependent synthetase/ligase [Penicillium concentricum]KAJ5375404.1 AMP-dependent synthetase/ligase [Penicillium concentricum]
MEEMIFSIIAHHAGVPKTSITPDSTFFQLGGNSIIALSTAAACRQQGIALTVGDILSSETVSGIVRAAKSTLIFDGAHSVQSPTLIETSSSASPFEFIARNSSEVEPRNRGQIQFISSPYQRPTQCIAQTEMQILLVSGSKRAPGTNVISYYQEVAPMEIPRLKQAWQAVIETEPIFHAAFDEDQLLERKFFMLSWSETIVNDEDAYQRLIDETESPPMVIPSTEFAVVTLNGPQGPQKSTLIWHVHHALVDGISGGTLLARVNVVLTGGALQLGRPFTDVVRELAWYQDHNAHRARSFWKTYFKPSSAEETILLPLPEFQGNPMRSTTGCVTGKLPLEKVQGFCQTQSISPSIVYYAAWALVLSQYTACKDIMFGVVLANRDVPIAGILETVGPLMNMLPLCLQIDRGQHALEFLQSVSNNLNMLSDYQWSKAEHGFSRNVSSAMAIQFDYEADHPQPPDGRSSYTKIQSGLPVDIFVGPKDRVQFNYSKDRFHHRDIGHVCGAFVSAIEALLIPSQRLELCVTQFIGSSLRQTLMDFGNCASEDTKSHGSETLVSLFTEQCRATPKSVAVRKGSTELSYRQIDEFSTRLARVLLQHIAPGDVVCVQANRSTNWIVAAWGVVKAQGAYCPMDPNSPPALRDSFCSIANARVFLATSEASKSCKPSYCQICYSVDEILAMQVPKRRWHNSVQPENNAYLCFTSGSTGLPKGVMCTHKGIVAFEKDYEARMMVGPGRKVPQVMSPAFDGSIHEIFATLSYGGTLVLNDSDDPFDNLKHSDVALLTPSLARMLDPIDYPNLRAVWLVGEPVTREIADTWASALPTYNMYGPTETSIGAAYNRIYPGVAITIGKPTRCARIYILDTYRNLLFPGMIGDVYIAGIQVSRGYVGRPDETDASFFTDSVCPGPGQMMYKTGDRGYWTTGGEVSLLGRADRQIKLRGFRLDLNDLEIRMVRGYSSAAAVALASVNDTLVALVQPIDVNIDSFRAKLRDVLPSYAIPGLVKAVSDFPVARSGKTDYAAIVNMFASCSDQSTWPVASSSLQDSRSKIIDIWRTVLKLDLSHPIRDNDHFVDMGGHSLEQLALASRLSSAFSKEIRARHVIDSPRLRDQVALFTAYTECAPNCVTNGNVAQILTPLGDTNPSPIEVEWWQKYNLRKGSTAFNVNYVCHLNRGVDIVSLAEAWNTVLARHDIFQSLYCAQRSKLVRTMSSSRPKVRYVSDIDIQQTINYEFDLSKDVPIRVYLSLDLLVLVASHIILDLTSLQTVLREVELVVKGGCLPPVTRRYSDTTRWNQPINPDCLEFWNASLRGLPFYPTPKRTTFHGASRVYKLPQEVMSSMTQYSMRYGVTFHQLCLAAISLCLRQNRPSDQPVVLGAPFLNRGLDDLDVVGLFLEPLPIRVNAPSDGTGLAYVRDTQQSSRDSLSHSIPWHSLLDHFEVHPNHPNVPFIEAVVTFHDHRAVRDFDVPGVLPLRTWCQGAKFNLMMEFCAQKDGPLFLRIEYDNANYEAIRIDTVQHSIMLVLMGLTKGLDIADIQTGLDNVSEIPPYIGDQYFAMRSLDL